MINENIKAPVFIVLAVILCIVLFQFNENKKLTTVIKQDAIHKTRQMQLLRSVIDITSKRSQFVQIARDSILKKYNNKLSDEEAYGFINAIEEYQNFDFILLDTGAGISDNVLYFNAIAEDVFVVVIVAFRISSGSTKKKAAGIGMAEYFNIGIGNIDTFGHNKSAG